MEEDPKQSSVIAEKQLEEKVEENSVPQETPKNSSKSNKKKIIIISSVVAGILLAAGIAGAVLFFLNSNKTKNLTSNTSPTISTTVTITPSDTTSPSVVETPTPTLTPTPTINVSSASVNVSPSSSTTCPTTFNFTGSIAAIGAGDVTYKWTRSDGVNTDNATVHFDSDGTKQVNYSWNLNATTSSWVKLIILEPNSLTSNQSNISLNCTPPADFSGSWYHNFGTMSLSQNGANVTGTYTNDLQATSGNISGTVNGNTLTANYTGGNSGTLSLTASGNTFDGSWTSSTSSTGKWCGAKAGSYFAGDCSFNGTWTINIPGTCSSGSMTLNRKNNTVSGTYCNGTFSGTLSYASGYAVATGTWLTSSIPETSGNATFYTNDYSSHQFQGNYNSGSYAWCGWRDGASQPSPCLK